LCPTAGLTIRAWSGIQINQKGEKKKMTSMPVTTLYMLLVGAFLLGLVVYDTLDTLVLHDRYSTRFNARRNFPIRLFVYGVSAVVIAGIWIFTVKWIVGTILVVGVVFTIASLIWFAKTHENTSTGG
jgi:hypothetical protein